MSIEAEGTLLGATYIEQRHCARVESCNKVVLSGRMKAEVTDCIKTRREDHPWGTQISQIPKLHSGILRATEKQRTLSWPPTDPIDGSLMRTDKVFGTVVLLVEVPHCNRTVGGSTGENVFVLLRGMPLHSGTVKVETTSFAHAQMTMNTHVVHGQDLDNISAGDQHALSIRRETDGCHWGSESKHRVRGRRVAHTTAEWRRG
mmetsp:Transcript_11416/g.34956  ORF Transcript_11416/g.34956 Transcript_11416/m.34956 type:complete len:203 (+) Transcript_11416:141-749(+)